MRLSARVVVLTRNQVVRYDTGGADPFDVGDYPMIAEALTSAKVVQGVVNTPAGRYAATAVPLVAPNVGSGTVAGVVLVIAPLRDVDAAVAAVQRQLFFATVLAMGVSLLLGYLASYFIARRLKRIERSAEAIAGGDLTATVPVTVEDEIGQLAATFNIMAVRLRGAFAQVEYERDRVEVLLNDLSEGVIGLSEEGTVTIANPASAELLDEPVPVGAELDETFPADVAEAWHESRREDETQAVVFVHGERTLEATTYPVAGAADFTSIVVLRDVTSQARLERARRDLIANASHEFKTPLFSLAGFLELIDEGNVNPEEQREFLQLMRQQVDRLRNLAVSMLDLSTVEAGSIEMQPEDVDLEVVARSVLDEFQVQAQAKDAHARRGRRRGRDGVVRRAAPGAGPARARRQRRQVLAARAAACAWPARADASWATIVVSDDGPGIARERSCRTSSSASTAAARSAPPPRAPGWASRSPASSPR